MDLVRDVGLHYDVNRSPNEEHQGSKIVDRRLLYLLKRSGDTAQFKQAQMRPLAYSTFTDNTEHEMNR